MSETKKLFDFLSIFDEVREPMFKMTKKEVPIGPVLEVLGDYAEKDSELKDFLARIVKDGGVKIYSDLGVLSGSAGLITLNDEVSYQMIRA